MTKLLVFAKSALVDPYSYSTFPQSPTDQQLFPGIADRVQQLRSEGWTMAIASNQAGCDIFTVQSSRVRVGNYIVHGKDDRYKVVAIDTSSDGGLIFRYDRERPTSQAYSFSFPESDVRVSYKTIESAIEECQFAADLCGIEDFVFCPTIDGLRMIVQAKNGVNGWLPTKNYSFGDYFGVGNFRKPGPGMLDFFHAMFSGFMPNDRAIMIGSWSDDFGAAEDAGFECIKADEWMNGKVSIDQTGESK